MLHQHQKNIRLERYKKTVNFINENFKQEINIEVIEKVSFYSYRNINRIFLALHQETIGKYIKRLKLEKAANHLKYTETSIAEIADEVGYVDIAAFSKAFKKHFKTAPSLFRNKLRTIELNSTKEKEQLSQEVKSIDYEIEYLPKLEIIYLEYKGSYDDIEAIEATWNNLVTYLEKHHLLSEHSIFLAEILDDNAITESVFCRLRAAMILERPLKFELKGLFQTKTIQHQKYAKFVHKGSHQSSSNTYQQIYTYWINHLDLEMEDKPNLEFYINDDGQTPTDELITEIYIPIK